MTAGTTCPTLTYRLQQVHRFYLLDSMVKWPFQQQKDGARMEAEAVDESGCEGGSQNGTKVGFKAWRAQPIVTTRQF